MRRPRWMDTFKFTVLIGILGILFLFTGPVKVAVFLIVTAFILFLATALLWFLWLLNVGRKK